MNTTIALPSPGNSRESMSTSAGQRLTAELQRTVRVLVFSASLRVGSQNSRLAARVIEQHGGEVHLATMDEFEAPSLRKPGLSSWAGRRMRSRPDLNRKAKGQSWGTMRRPAN